MVRTVEPEEQESLCSREDEGGRGSCGLVQLERPILLLFGGSTRPQRDLREEGSNRNLAETGGLQRKKERKVVRKCGKAGKCIPKRSPKGVKPPEADSKVAHSGAITCVKTKKAPSGALLPLSKWVYGADERTKSGDREQHSETE